MKAMSLRILIICAGVVFIQDHALYAQLSVVGEIRPRAEYRNGFKTLSEEADDPAFFIEQRSRLYTRYKKDNLSLGITVQDVRIWGSVDQIYKDDPSLTNLAEAWAAYRFHSNISLKVGRQVLAYDNDRILGSLDWAQQSRSHDLALLQFSDSTWQFHLGAAFNQDAATPEYAKLSSTYYSGVANYKTMQFAWFHKEIKQGQLSLLFLNNGIQVGSDTASSVNFSQTIGGIFKKKVGLASLQAEFYQQFGESASSKHINAQLIAANISFPVGKVKLSAGVDYLSGSSYEESNSDRAFNPLYGTHHKFYGFMDYFYVGNPHTQNGFTTGLLDLYINPVFNISPKTTIVTAVHQFLSPINIYTSGTPAQPFTGETKNNLGTEVDLVLNLALTDEVKLNLGYSQLFATSALRAIKNGGSDELNNWAWLMLSLKPKIL